MQVAIDKEEAAHH